MRVAVVALLLVVGCQAENTTKATFPALVPATSHEKMLIREWCQKQYDDPSLEVDVDDFGEETDSEIDGKETKVSYFGARIRSNNQELDNQVLIFTLHSGRVIQAKKWISPC